MRTSTTWQPGQSGNPLGRPPTKRATLDAQMRSLFALAIEQQREDFPAKAVLMLALRSNTGVGFRLLGRYQRMWWQMNAGTDDMSPLGG